MSRLSSGSPSWQHHLPALAALVFGLCAAVVLPERGLENAAGFHVLLGLTVPWSLAAILAGRVAGPGIGVGVVGVAILLRLALLMTSPSLSDDVFRYVWEGRVANAGFNPFWLAPNDPALAPLRDALWARVNHPAVPTIYPPGALLAFQLIAGPGGTTLWRAAAALADLGVVWALARVARGRGLSGWAPTVYALHPLPILESAGNGHLESVALCAFAWGLAAADARRPDRALPWLAAGALVKLLPAAAALPVLRRTEPGRLRGLMIAGALALTVSLPLLFLGGPGGQGFRTYYENWAFNATLFRVLQHLVPDPSAARAAGVALGGAWCLVALWRSRDPARFQLSVAGALLLLSPVVHPWYALWAFVPALVVEAVPWVVFGGTSLLSYVVLAGYDPVTQTGWQEPSWLFWSQILPFCVALWRWPPRRWRDFAPPEV